MKCNELDILFACSLVNTLTLLPPRKETKRRPPNAAAAAGVAAAGGLNGNGGGGGGGGGGAERERSGSSVTFADGIAVRACPDAETEVAAGKCC